MSTLAERFDALKQHIQTEKYLQGKGNSNEVNITMFCYEPKQEMEMRAYTQNLLADKTLKCRVIEKNLYKTFIEICQDEDILDDIPEMEASDGKASLQETLTKDIITTRQFINKLNDQEFVSGRDVLLLTGVGEVYPFMRMHTLLEGMPTVFKDIPILVFYPGTFNGVELRLFNKLSPNPYYRAFNPFGY